MGVQSTPHEWKGAGEPEENVMDQGGKYEPDYPETAEYEWKGAGEPEENTFDDLDVRCASFPTLHCALRHLC